MTIVEKIGNGVTLGLQAVSITFQNKIISFVFVAYNLALRSSFSLQLPQLSVWYLRYPTQFFSVYLVTFIAVLIAIATKHLVDREPITFKELATTSTKVNKINFLLYVAVMYSIDLLLQLTEITPLSTALSTLQTLAFFFMIPVITFQKHSFTKTFIRSCHLFVKLFVETLTSLLFLVGSTTLVTISVFFVVKMITPSTSDATILLYTLSVFSLFLLVIIEHLKTVLYLYDERNEEVEIELEILKTPEF